jgi:hypothetical protein
MCNMKMNDKKEKKMMGETLSFIYLITTTIPSLIYA